MAEIIEFPKKHLINEDKLLVGKLLMLNSGLVPKFQCGGFSVNPGRMVDIVTEKTQLVAIKIALEKGILIDVSNNNLVTKGFEFKNSSTSNVLSEDTDKKAFVGRDKFGRMFVIVPKNDEEKKKFEEQIAETGNIKFNPEESEDFTGFSPIVEEPLPINKEQ